MPMVWRTLHTLEFLIKHHAVEFSASEIAHVYNLRGHGSSRFLFQIKPGMTHLILKTTQNDSNWKNSIFFVRRDSIPEGDKLSIKWIVKGRILPSSKFDILAPPTPGTAKKVAALFGFEPIERTFRFKAPLLEVEPDISFSESTMSGLRKSSSKFSLDDIDSMVSKGKVVKKEAEAVPAPVSKLSAPNPDTSTVKPSSSKKRNIQDPVDLNIRNCTDFFDAHKKLHNFNHLLVKEMELCIEKLADSQKNKAAKGKRLLDVTKELHQIKAELQEAYLQHVRDIDASNEQAYAWDVEGWKRLVVELTLEKDAGKVVAKDQVQGSVMVVEEHEAASAGKMVDQGNEVAFDYPAMIVLEIECVCRNLRYAGYLNVGEMANLCLVLGSLEILLARHEFLVKVGVI
ncbi:hypothetical protein L1987_38019 [Smallanthus sonchifolius]|uniref:Uncharacterized protein n=1 Tax=Smallanthus sonchifolius TaxID=185202 RepID=A0ACB9HHX1_9ASTR|nr:hypothetical protein L1987_38019 [Smallanthus sonchifolius]